MLARPEGAELSAGNSSVTALYYKIDRLDQAGNLSVLFETIARAVGRSVFVLNAGLHLHAGAPERLHVGSR